MSERKAPAEGWRKTGRIDAVDCARGLALIGMAVYHLIWDLADFRLVSPLLPFSPPMRLLSHTVAIAFLALVGVSLALAHRDRLNLPAFWRRLAIVAGAAALVTASSLVFAPGQGIWFGILHCIAVASLVALPFVEAPRGQVFSRGRRRSPCPFLSTRRCLTRRRFSARPRRGAAEHTRLASAAAVGGRRPHRPRPGPPALGPPVAGLSVALAREVRPGARSLSGRKT